MTNSLSMLEISIIDLGGLVYEGKKVYFKTNQYTPPEFRLKKKYSARTAFSVWSVGITILELILGHPKWGTKEYILNCAFKNMEKVEVEIQNT